MSPRPWTFRDAIANREYELHQLGAALDDAGFSEAAAAVEVAKIRLAAALIATPKDAVMPEASNPAAGRFP